MHRGLNRHLLDRLAVEGVRLVEGEGGTGGDGSQDGGGSGDGSQDGGNGAQGSADGAAGGGSGDGPAGSAGGAQNGAQGGTGGQGNGDGTDLSDLSQEQLTRMVRDLRKENGAARTNAKQEAATSAKKELAQEVGKMLGLVEDDTSDPDKLKNQLGSAQQKHRETAVELAVHRAAGKHGADPDALLDSNGFLTAAHNLDPTDDGFAGHLDDAIKTAVESNNKLRAAPAAGRSGAEFTGGSGGQRTYTRAEIAGMSPDDYATNEKAILQAMADGRVTR